MDKRLLMALFLCFILLWAHQALFPPAPKPEPVTPQAGGETAQPSDESAFVPGEEASAAGVEPLPAEPGAEEPAAQPALYEATGVETEIPVVLETDVYRAVLSNRGGVLESLKFKHYYIDPDVQKNPAKMADPAYWLEILGPIQDGTPSFVLKDGRSRTGSSGYGLDEALWETETLELYGEAPRVVFALKTGDGLIFRKIFSFQRAAYHIDFRVEVENLAPGRQENLNLILEGIAGISDRKRASFSMGPSAVLYISDRNDPEAGAELIDRDPSKLDADFNFTLGKSVVLHFTGVQNNYFALLLEPGAGDLLRQVTFKALEDSEKVAEAIEEFRRERGAIPTPEREESFRAKAMTNIRANLLLGVRVPAPGETASQDFLFYAGPKLAEIMRYEPYGGFFPLIEESYGWSFAWVNKTLIWILKQFRSLFGNWGVAIIFLTFVVKIMLFPLNRVQQVSMHKYSQKMSKLKPKLDELKSRYKNNKKKYNEEQMKLMKEHGATPPLLGCLLIFFQFPIFIGLFQALRTSFELRHSPFCLWIKDLSQPDALPLPFTLPLIGDTLNVVPIGMTLAFFFQQKAMPKPADAQSQQTQKIMMFMPFIFGIMFYGYASGLSLYWMTSNLISIVEYKFIRKKFPVAPAAEQAPAPAAPEADGKEPSRLSEKRKQKDMRRRNAARRS